MLFKKWATTLMGSIPYQNPFQQDHKMILHVSDIPSFVYGEIGQLIQKTNPAYIVITGDLCDNIQLRQHPSKLMKYERNLYELANILNKAHLEALYICPSKEDSMHSIRKFFPKAVLVAPGDTVTIEGKTFTLAHSGQDVLAGPGTFNLFGHDLYLQSHDTDQRHFLNGLEHIHLIDTGSWAITRIQYPLGTNSTRNLIK